MPSIAACRLSSLSTGVLRKYIDRRARPRATGSLHILHAYYERCVCVCVTRLQGCAPNSVTFSFAREHFTPSYDFPSPYFDVLHPDHAPPPGKTDTHFT
eukprot:4221902-Prymnesium_polylepis.2